MYIRYSRGYTLPYKAKLYRRKWSLFSLAWGLGSSRAEARKKVIAKYFASIESDSSYDTEKWNP